LALGQMAFDGVLRSWRATGWELPRMRFKHGAWHNLANELPVLAASYHPSRQNTNTGVLTDAMLDQVLMRIRDFLKGKSDIYE
jgi:uracil-DNA glycosylase